MKCLVTLVPGSFAKKGTKFRFWGLPPSCKDCKLYKLCSRLRKGLLYSIEEIRSVKHKCSLHGEVIIVKVKLEPIEMMIPSKFAIEGIKFTYSKQCNVIECPYFNLCNPIGLREGDSLKIIKVMSSKNITCNRKKLIFVLAELL